VFSRSLLALVVLSSVAEAQTVNEIRDKDEARLRMERVFSNPYPVTPYDAVARFSEALPPDAVTLVRTAGSVEIIRLKGEYVTERATKGQPSVGGFAIESRKTASDPNFLRRLKDLVLAPTAYAFYLGNKFCGGFQPKVVYRFCEAKRCIELRVCFNCEDVEVSVSAGNAKQEVTRIATMTDDDWWVLAKESFPDDAFIQKQSRRH
jgi:hypothetical protein